MSGVVSASIAVVRSSGIIPVALVRVRTIPTILYMFVNMLMILNVGTLRCASRSRHASKYASLTGSNAAPALASCAAPITAPRHIVRPSTAKLPHKGAAPQVTGAADGAER